MAIWKNFAKVGSATILSRVLGFIRDAMIAGALGAGPVADAFVVAFRLPNLFRRLFAEGVFNSAFVPLYARVLTAEGEAGAARFAGEIASGLLTTLLVFSGLAIILAPWLVDVLAFGFGPDSQKFELTVVLTRICLPYLACMSIIGLLGGILSAHRRYMAPAMAPVVLNLVLISALFAIDVGGYMRSVEAGYILAIGVTVSGLCQLLMVASAVWRGGFGFTLHLPRMTPSIRRLMANSVPAFVGGGITQINIVVGTAIASLKAGAVANLYYADRIYQLPLGVIGIAIGVVLLPELLHRIRIGREDLAMDTQNRSLEMALALTLPAAFGLVAAAHPIVEVLFERGAFGPRDTDMTALALQGFALGLPAFVAVKVLTAAFFARLDLKTPMWAGLVAVIVNLALSISLFQRFGGTGIAIATSAAGWINAGVLWVALARRSHWRVDGPLEHRLPRLAIASLAMGLVVWVLREVLDRWLGAENAFLIKVGALAGMITIGAGVFLAIGLLIGGIDLASIRAGLKSDETLEDDPLIAVLSSD
jgi:putative peptidoglycan lipid II flippase